MKSNKPTFPAIIFAFLGILVSWLFSQHFTDLVAFWQAAKAKVTPAPAPVAPASQPSATESENEQGA